MKCENARQVREDQPGVPLLVSVLVSVGAFRLVWAVRRAFPQQTADAPGDVNSPRDDGRRVRCRVDVSSVP
jgi:hypothetical protein